MRGIKAEGGSLADPPKRLGLRFEDGAKPWGTEADVVLPCATENEMDGEDAKAALDAGARVIAEGANMPLTADAAEVIADPGKASNAGGVAISGLEMSQNAHGRFSSAQEVDSALKSIMQDIHDRALAEGSGGDNGEIDYRRGANIAAYRKVATAISAFGIG